MEFQKRLRNMFVVIVLGLFAFNLIKTLFQTYRTSTQLEVLEQEVEALQKEKIDLLVMQDYRMSDEFLEREARNKLNLIRPGESVVIMDEIEGNGQIPEVAGARLTNYSIPMQWKLLLGF